MSQSLLSAKVSFTGKLASLSRKEAEHIVSDAGGETTPSVLRQTSYVVVGMEGWPLLPDGLISNKLRRAEDLIKRGFPLQILSETSFLELAGLKERQVSLRKVYPEQEISRLMKISPETLRRWEQFGLVKSCGGEYDFQDLVSMRTIGELVKRGVRPETIAGSLKSLAAILPDTDRPLAQLKLVAEAPQKILVDFGDYMMAPNGQLMIQFDASPKPISKVISLPSHDHTASEWFEYGQCAEEEERYYDAEEAYRQALSLSAYFPEAYFNLGNVHRVQEKLGSAEESYRMAVSQSPQMACAWYNLADVQEEQGRNEEAIASLKKSLLADPQFLHAHFNLAICYQKIGQESEAARHWSAYLRFDNSSPWAEIARRKLSHS